MRQACLLSALLLSFSLALPVPGRALVVFDAIVGYQNRPAGGPVGIQWLVLANHEVFWPDLAQGKKDRTWPSVIDAAAEERLAGRARAWKAQGLAWICFDIEHLDPVKDPAAFNAFWIRAAAIVRREAPGLKLGFYGLPPIRDYHRASRPRRSPEFRSWRAENRALSPGAQAMDAIFPSLYTFYADEDGWLRYAARNIAEARRYGRPVYPFLWPRYHDSHRTLAWELIPLSYWKKQLAAVASQTDALVIWDYGQRAEWDEAAPWWQAVKDLAAEEQP